MASYSDTGNRKGREHVMIQPKSTAPDLDSTIETADSADFTDFEGQARPSLRVQKNKFVPLNVAGFNPEEVLRSLSEHRFRPEGQIPKIGIWVKHSISCGMSQSKAR